MAARLSLSFAKAYFEISNWPEIRSSRPGGPSVPRIPWTKLSRAAGVKGAMVRPSQF